MVKFEKRHFEFLAEMLKDTKPTSPSALIYWRATVSKITKRLRQTNSNFKEEKFLVACGLEDTEQPK